MLLIFAVSLIAYLVIRFINYIITKYAQTNTANNTLINSLLFLRHVIYALCSLAVCLTAIILIFYAIEKRHLSFFYGTEISWLILDKALGSAFLASFSLSVIAIIFCSPIVSAILIEKIIQFTKIQNQYLKFTLHALTVIGIFYGYLLLYKTRSDVDSCESHYRTLNEYKMIEEFLFGESDIDESVHSVSYYINCRPDVAIFQITQPTETQVTEKEGVEFFLRNSSISILKSYSHFNKKFQGFGFSPFLSSASSIALPIISLVADILGIYAFIKALKK